MKNILNIVRALLFVGFSTLANIPLCGVAPICADNCTKEILVCFHLFPFLRLSQYMF